MNVEGILQEESKIKRELPLEILSRRVNNPTDMIHPLIPGSTGGKLIREVIRRVKEDRRALPQPSFVHIAVSGGSDSLALAHLLVHYGSRVVPRHKIRLIHMNHGWRGVESDGDAHFIGELAERWKIPLRTFSAKPPPTQGSPESQAREDRKDAYRQAVCEFPGWVLTAHHADDLAETVLWRILTGAATTHGAGILPVEPLEGADSFELRPLLGTRKTVLQEYLSEEKQEWREDRTNFEGQLLRSRLRLNVMPQVEHLFPRAVENLVRLAEQTAKKSNPSDPHPTALLADILGSSGVRMRRSQWDAMKAGRCVTLAQGWSLTYDQSGQSRRWVLEAPDSSKELPLHLKK